MNREIRLATSRDAAQIRQIYGPIVRETTISFEREVPSVDEMEGRIAATLQWYPWLVCERGGAVVGYAYASRHRARASYDWSVETSVYIRESTRRTGVGRALYEKLFALLGLQGYYNAYAGIALPNAASVALHEAVGFRRIGVYEGVGFKMGSWCDVGWWQRELRQRSGPPAPPLLLDRAKALDGWKAVLDGGLASV